MKDSLKKILLSKNILAIDSVASGGKKTIPENKPLIGAMLKSFNSLGYTLSKTAVNKLSKLNAVELKLVYREAYKFLSSVMGADVNTKKVFYQKFPEIQDISEAEMYFNAIMHYVTVFFKDVTDGAIDEIYYPEEDKDFVRLPFDEKVKPIVVDVAFHYEADTVLEAYFVDSFESPVVIPDTRKQALRDIIDHIKNRPYCFDSKVFVPKTIPFKENMVFYIDVMSKLCGGLKDYMVTDGALDFLNTITDALRLYGALSCGHAMVPLPKGCKYSSFGRPIRRAFLTYLETTLKDSAAKSEDFAKHREEWLRVFEKLHPGEFKNQFPVTFHYANLLRMDAIKTHAAKVEAAYGSKDPKELIRLLSQRPGYFARGLDRAVRTFGWKTADIIEAFEKVIVEISSPVLIQLIEHFGHRVTEDDDMRIFAIKGEYGTTYYGKEENRPSLKDNNALFALSSAIWKELGLRIRESSGLAGKKVYVSDSMHHYRIPANDRAVSGSLRPIPAGSYIEVPGDKNVVRLFSHWHNMSNTDGWSGRVDIDLSCQVLDENFKYLRTLGWHSPFHNGKAMAFSGDITDAPNGANEFIDLNLDAVKRELPEARYFLIVNNVYTGQRYCDIPECYTGAMLREGVGDRGEIFEPSTVVAKFDLTQPTSGAIACSVFDAQERRLYNVDLPLAAKVKAVVGSRVAAGQVASFEIMLRRVLAKGASMFNLINAGSMAPNSYELVSDPKEADYVISDEDGADLHPWDQEKIAKMFMSGIDKRK